MEMAFQIQKISKEKGGTNVFGLGGNACLLPAIFLSSKPVLLQDNPSVLLSPPSSLFWWQNFVRTGSQNWTLNSGPYM